MPLVFTNNHDIRTVERFNDQPFDLPAKFAWNYACELAENQGSDLQVRHLLRGVLCSREATPFVADSPEQFTHVRRRAMQTVAAFLVVGQPLLVSSHVLAVVHRAAELPGTYITIAHLLYGLATSDELPAGVFPDPASVAQRARLHCLGHVTLSASTVPEPGPVDRDAPSPHAAAPDPLPDNLLNLLIDDLTAERLLEVRPAVVASLVTEYWARRREGFVVLFGFDVDALWLLSVRRGDVPYLSVFRLARVLRVLRVIVTVSAMSDEYLETVVRRAEDSDIWLSPASRRSLVRRAFLSAAVPAEQVLLCETVDDRVTPKKQAALRTLIRMMAPAVTGADDSMRFWAGRHGLPVSRPEAAVQATPAPAPAPAVEHSYGPSPLTRLLEAGQLGPTTLLRQMGRDVMDEATARSVLSQGFADGVTAAAETTQAQARDAVGRELEPSWDGGLQLTADVLEALAGTGITRIDAVTIERTRVAVTELRAHAIAGRQVTMLCDPEVLLEWLAGSFPTSQSLWDTLARHIWALARVLQVLRTVAYTTPDPRHADALARARSVGLSGLTHDLRHTLLAEVFRRRQPATEAMVLCCCYRVSLADDAAAVQALLEAAGPAASVPGAIPPDVVGPLVRIAQTASSVFLGQLVATAGNDSVFVSHSTAQAMTVVSALTLCDTTNTRGRVHYLATPAPSAVPGSTAFTVTPGSIVDGWYYLKVGERLEAGDEYCWQGGTPFVIGGPRTGLKPGDAVHPEIMCYFPRRRLSVHASLRRPVLRLSLHTHKEAP